MLVVLISNALVFLATILIGNLFRQEPPWEKAHIAETYQLAEKAVSVYESKGQDDLKAFQADLGKKRHSRFFLLDQNRVSLGRKLPEEIAEQLDSLPAFIRPFENKAGRYSIYAVPVAGTYDRRYYFVATFALPPFDRHPGGRFDFRFIWVILGIAVSSALVAWLINQPLRELQKTTRQLAEGKLDTRVSTSLEKRRDAIGDLAREFNTMAEQVDSLLSSHKRLLRDVSHELRSPLARMQVALSLLEQRSMEAPGKEQQRIQLEIERLNALIGQIITLSRLDSGAEHLRPEPLDLVAMVRDLIEDVRYEHSHDDRQMWYSGPDSLTLSADPLRLQSAIENVLRNAMAYTADNTSVTVEVSASPTQCEIVVTDHGPGVPEQDLSRIFDAFYRTQDAREEKTGGTGVGLAISRRIVELHGGLIRAENMSGNGLRIVISLPLQNA
ncbi:MAG: HAMP domain-containing protein [Gammaproteobacteria bacterium]|nr:HAMP domain-containing protein [Gammaproteobacteria bacterium]